jgi:uncharacterized cupredoxin-like copper-binding protein
MKVRLVLDSLKEGYVHEIKAEGLRSGNNLSLMHNYGYYTLNRIPDGDKLTITDANRVVATVKHDHEAMMAAAAAATGSKKPTATAAATTKSATAAVKRLTVQPASWTKGPDRTITLTTRPGLKFDVEAVIVKAGSKIKLTFNNNDDMLHNVVVTEPGAATSVGEMAIKLGINGERMSYVPNTPKVLYHTVLLQPNKSESIYFTAPDKPGEYEYLCSYPGHYMVMRGIMKVEK